MCSTFCSWSELFAYIYRMSIKVDAALHEHIVLIKRTKKFLINIDPKPLVSMLEEVIESAHLTNQLVHHKLCFYALNTPNK
jgi:hypothetical protein